jgi:probable rRNA maturation factor
MSGTLSVRNRQRLRRVNTSLLRSIAHCILGEHLCIKDFELAIHLVAAPEMTHVNETFLQHEGSTDVITFDYSNKVGIASSLSRTGKRFAKRQHIAAATTDLSTCMDILETQLSLHGELLICLDEAVAQARRFRTTWQSELVRYMIHGLLHLCGHDDLKPAARRQMKRVENRFLCEATRRFELANLDARISNRGKARSAI